MRILLWRKIGVKVKQFEKLPIIFDEQKLVDALDQVLSIAPFDDTKKNPHQVCLTKKPGELPPDCYYEGVGGIYRTMVDGQEVMRQQALDERDYSEFIPEFEHTYFKEVYDTIRDHVFHWDSVIGRVRLIRSVPRACLSWHRDPESRIHVPIVTNIGAKLVIEDEVKHLPVGRAWYTNTINYHSQFNGGETDRIHFVAAITSVDSFWAK